MGFEITVDEQVEALQDELDVFDFVAGTVLPEADVTVYSNAKAAVRLNEIYEAEAARNAKEEAEGLGLTDEDVKSTDEDEVNALHEQLVASGLVFHLQGIAPAAYKALEAGVRAKNDYKAGAENREYTLALNNELVAHSIVSVTAPNGKTRTRTWDADEVNTFTDNLYPSEANKLCIKAQELTYVMDIFDRTVTADFS